MAMHGFGYIGKIHVMAAQLALFGGQLSEPIRFTNCVVRDKSSFAAQAASHVFEVVSEDADQLAGEGINAVDVVSPNHVHDQAVRVAATAGLAIYCEKPLAHSLTTSEQMVESVQRHGLLNQVALIYRFHPAVEQAVSLLQSGRLGKPLTFRAVLLHGGYLDPKRPAAWRLNAEHAGAGAIMDLGVHMIDIVHLLLGDVTSVQASMQTFVSKRDNRNGGSVPVTVDDWAHLVLTTRTGATGTLEVSRVHYGLEDARLTIVCQNGTIDLPLEALGDVKVHTLAHQVETESQNGNLVLEKYRPSLKMTQDVLLSCHTTSLVAFVERVRGTVVDYPIPTFEDALRAERVVQAAKDSAAAGSTRQYVTS